MTRIHPLFADLGTLKVRGRQYEAVLSDLRAQYRRDEIRRTQTKADRKRQRSNEIRQAGSP